MSRKIFRLAAFCVLFILIVPNASSQEWKLGVLAPRGELKANARWQALAEHLQQQLGSPIKLVPLPPAKVIAAADGGEIDFLLSHSPHTVYVAEKLGARVLATLNPPAGPRFGGVIISKKDSGIRSAEDLRGKQVMSLKFKAAAGAYIFQTHHLMQKGIDPHKDFASIREGKKQDDLVLAVKNGLIDAAFVRTGLLENMEREGKIKLAEFEIVDNRQDPEFPLLHTTELYPEWCLSALPSVSTEDAERMTQTVLQVSPDLEAARKARIQGFVSPVPLEGISQALRSLHIAPYNI